MKKGIACLLLFLPFIAMAQTETDIRKHYTDVNKRISESLEQGYEGPLYQSQWVTNKNGRSWPAVGIYADTADFWYDDPPDHLPATERNPRNVLLKVNVSRHASHLYTEEEYLFRDGKLLFYYSHEGEEGNEWETRVYYTVKGVAFKSSVKANGKELTAKDFLKEDYKDFKPNPARILVAARNFQELFLKAM